MISLLNRIEALAAEYERQQQHFRNGNQVYQEHKAEGAEQAMHRLANELRAAFYDATAKHTGLCYCQRLALAATGETAGDAHRQLDWLNAGQALATPATTAPNGSNQ